MKHALIVIDDFYDDPDAVRRSALALNFTREAGVNYPGHVAALEQDIAPIFGRFSTFLGGVSLKFRGPQGSFRITTATDMATRNSLVHVDSSDYSAIVHLSQEPMEGTYFYRHKALGIDYVTPEHNQDPAVRRAIERDTLELSAWEVTQCVAMRYNRLLIFDGKYFHSGAQELRGHQLSEGRLTQNFFFFRA